MSSRTLLALAAACGLTAPALAQTAPLRTIADEEWCDDGGDGDRARHCIVYEGAWPAGGALAVDARPNGGIHVRGWDRNEVRLRAKVVAYADEEAEARELASRVRIETGGTIRAEGPARDRSYQEGRQRSWSVSYKLDVPSGSTLSLESTNGGIHLGDVTGDITFNTTNGGLHLERVGGRLKGRTTNGGLHVELEGTEWQGEGLDLLTTNGGVHLSVPRGYNAQLETGTTNGRVHADLPEVKAAELQDEQGGSDRRHRHRRVRRIDAQLGRGGKPIRLQTTNGSVHVSQN